MNEAHLTSDELDLVLIGEDLPGARAAHLGECVYCRRRSNELQAAIAGAALPDPGLPLRERVRAAALSELPHGHRRWRRWLAAAAALVVMAAATVFTVTERRQPPIDADAILLEVDEVLSRDPLAAVADETVVEVVVANTSTTEAHPSSS